MMPFPKPIRPARNPLALTLFVAAVLVLLLLAARALLAQVEGERGIAPIAASSDFNVRNIKVDVRGKTAEAAREEGWRVAQRKAWAKVGGPKLPDSQLFSLVSAVVIQHEQTGPHRYIATLGVIFDRQRAGSYLGGASQAKPSSPLLVIPVTFTAGTQLVYERRNPWQRAWAEFQPGNSRINYVRPSGAGGDSLLITYGQTGRRSRVWWRNVLDQFGAASVLVPIARLDYSYPGGPITGTFTARYGPDSLFLDSFTMRADSPDKLPQMLANAVQRFDKIFQQALAKGTLRPDPTLEIAEPQLSPALQRLLEMGRAAEQQRVLDEEGAPAAVGASGAPVPASPTPTTTAAVVSSYVVQFATPDASSFDDTLRAVRAAAGVRGVATSSTAIGGTSVMRVSYGGSLEQLAAALRAGGFSVRQGNNALLISR